MFWRKKYLCSSCKTGKVSYELDKVVEVCPYIRNWGNNKCSFYKPLEEEKRSLFDKILKLSCID